MASELCALVIKSKQYYKSELFFELFAWGFMGNKLEKWKSSNGEIFEDVEIRCDSDLV